MKRSEIQVGKTYSDKTGKVKRKVLYKGLPRPLGFSIIYEDEYGDHFTLENSFLKWAKKVVGEEGSSKS